MILAVLVCSGSVGTLAQEEQNDTQTDAIDIGSRRQLFVDDHLLKRSSNVRLQVQQPTAEEVVMTHDDPWELTNRGGYHTIFEDDGTYRMWYRAGDVRSELELTCYAESTDGITWRKPDLGLFEVDGSTENNVVWRSSNGPGRISHNMTVFKDPTEPAGSDALYRAVGGLGHGAVDKQRGLFGLISPDGIEWSLVQQDPILPPEWGAYDSQNTVFWDPNTEEYKCYFRYFTNGWPNGLRAIRVSTSEDFINWTEPEPLTYEPEQDQHLYTNNVRPYPRNPHLYIGFPVRFLSPETEPLFMASRDGRHFRRYEQAIIPRDAPKGRHGNRSNYVLYGLEQLPGDEGQYSLYASESHGHRLRRFTYRLDGFVSLTSAPEGEAVTKPLRFEGDSLVLNYETDDGGSVKVAVLRPNGEPYAGFSLADASPLSGDEIAASVTWDGDRGLEALAGAPVRLKFHLSNAQVYSFQFRTE